MMLHPQCTIEVDLLVSRIFGGESVGNLCWHYFNLAKSCSCYTYNSYETILALFKFCGQTKSHQATKLKAPPNIQRVRYGTYIHTYCKYCCEIKCTTSTVILKFIICAVSNKFSIIQNFRGSSM